MQTPIAPLVRIIAEALKTGELITLLTGAGVSAESGIPTFRGREGYWTVGSKNYQPSGIATLSMLQQNPKEGWKWFLFRRGFCEAATPNPGHLAIAQMEERLGSRFRLITQNVDGLPATRTKERIRFTAIWTTCAALESAVLMQYIRFRKA